MVEFLDDGHLSPRAAVDFPSHRDLVGVVAEPKDRHNHDVFKFAEMVAPMFCSVEQ